jgi:cytochrome c oxidase assembly factor 4
MSSSESGHKRTKKVNECEITPVDKDDQEDPVIKNLSKLGCLEKHYAVQDCYFDTKDWRKCTKEVKDFKECIDKAKK